MTPPWDENMSYSFHKYWSETTLATIQSYISMSNQYSIPLWMGESGENSNHWYYEVFKLLEENNIGWNFWTHKKVDKITSPYSEYKYIIKNNDSIEKILNTFNINKKEIQIIAQSTIIVMGEC